MTFQFFFSWGGGTVSTLYGQIKVKGFNGHLHHGFPLTGYGHCGRSSGVRGIVGPRMRLMNQKSRDAEGDE